MSQVTTHKSVDLKYTKDYNTTSKSVDLKHKYMHNKD
jgi:hypothetical protein